jgi:hypothetical protein
MLPPEQMVEVALLTVVGEQQENAALVGYRQVAGEGVSSE